MKDINAKCSQVKRKLLKDEPLTGDLLEFALDLLGTEEHKKNHPVFQNISDQLKSGKPLGEYESHIMLHVRLGAK